MKEKTKWKAAAVMLACTVIIVAGGAAGLNAAMEHLQSGGLASESSHTPSGQDPDGEEILLSGIGQTDTDSVALESTQDSLEKQNNKGSQESAGDTIAVTGKRAEYFARTYGGFADSTEDKVYLHALDFHNRLYYLDRKTGQFGFLCGKDGCEHHATNCNAYFSHELKADTLQVVDGKVYVFEGSFHKDPYLNAVLYRMDLDGSNREKATKFRAYAALGNARIIDGVIYAQGEMSDGSGSHLFKQTLYGEQDAEEIFPAGHKDWNYRRIRLSAAVGDKLYFQASRYKGDTGEDPVWEFSIWEYDTKNGLFTELLDSNYNMSYFVAEGWLYYAIFQYSPDKEFTTYGPVMRQNLTTGQTEQTELARGGLAGYDGVYCYINTYAADGKFKSVEVYTLDGKAVQSIASPAPSDALGDYEWSSIGCTYDAIVLHNRYSTNIDGNSHYFEDIYVYDKKQIGTAGTTWAKLTLHEWQDGNAEEMKQEIKQGYH